MFRVDRNRDREFSIGEPPEAAETNKGDADNFDAGIVGAEAHVKETIGDLLVLLGDVAQTRLGGGGVRPTIAVAGAAVNQVDYVAALTLTVTTADVTADATRGNSDHTVCSRHLRAYVTRLAAATPPIAEAAITKEQLFTEAKRLLLQRKKLILNLLESAADIDAATANKNGRVINSENATVNGTSVDIAIKELDAILGKSSFAAVGADGNNQRIDFRNLINVLRFHTRAIDQKIDVNNNNYTTFIDTLAMTDDAGVGIFCLPNGANGPVAAAAAGGGGPNIPAALAAGLGVYGVALADILNQLKNSLKAIPTRAAFLKKFGADVPGSAAHQRFVGVDNVPVDGEVAVIPVDGNAPVPSVRSPAIPAINTSNAIIKNLQSLFPIASHRTLFGAPNGGIGVAAAAAGNAGLMALVNNADGQLRVIATLRRVFNNLPTVAANTNAHRFLGHIVWAPTNLRRVPEGFKWASAKEFMGVLGLTPVDKKGLANILNCNPDEVIMKISKNAEFNKALKELQDTSNTVQIETYLKNPLKVNEVHNMNLGTFNPQMLRFMNIIRKKRTPQTMANVGVPGSINIALPGMLPGFPPGMLGGAMAAPPTDFPIEMRGGGYNIGMMKGGYSGLIGPFRPITDESFISSSLDAAIQSLKDRITSGKGTLDSSTAQKIDALVEKLKTTETQVKNNRDNLIAMNNAISTGRFKPEDGHVYTAKEIATVAKTYNEVNKMRQSLENKLTRVVITLNGVTQNFTS